MNERIEAPLPQPLQVTVFILPSMNKILNYEKTSVGVSFLVRNIPINSIITFDYLRLDGELELFLFIMK